MLLTVCGKPGNKKRRRLVETQNAGGKDGVGGDRLSRKKRIFLKMTIECGTELRLIAQLWNVCSD